MAAGKRDLASPLMRREPAWRLNALSKNNRAAIDETRRERYNRALEFARQRRP